MIVGFIGKKSFTISLCLYCGQCRSCGHQTGKTIFPFLIVDILSFCRTLENFLSVVLSSLWPNISHDLGTYEKQPSIIIVVNVRKYLTIQIVKGKCTYLVSKDW